MNKKIAIGLSGGVDSSVSALLLKQQGYDVIGIFMKNWEEDDNDNYCAAAQDLADAKAICDQLNIPLYPINFAALYWDLVFENFLSEYKAGRTPNPDILCNREIKFKAFLSYAKTLGVEKIAMGHYAQIETLDQNVRLKRGIDHNKDQTYFLYALSQHQLQQAIFPIGHLKKDDVRALAKQHGLITHNKKDSTGICFIGERRFKSFLEQYLPAQPGPIVTDAGQEIGEHHGLMYYTLGQRQGLNIGGLKGFQESPWYVAQKDLTHNKLIVVQDPKHPLLMNDQLSASQLNWIDGPPSVGQSVLAQIRHRQTPQACTVEDINEQTIKIKFESTQRAIAPGQSVVLYDGEYCLGGGVIF